MRLPLTLPSIAALLLSAAGCITVHYDTPAPVPATAQDGQAGAGGGDDPEPSPTPGAPACAEGLTACQGACRELADDPMNCGSCAHVCPAEDVCSQGTCVIACPTGLTACPIATAGLPPAATTTLHLVGNLDARTSPKGLVFDPDDAVAASDFSTSFDVYDGLGLDHAISLYFVAQGAGDWEVHVVASGAEMAQPEQGFVELTPVPITLSFDLGGALATVTETTVTIAFANAQGTSLALDLGVPTSDGGTGLAGVTQFGSLSAAHAQWQDGHAAVAPANAGIEGEACVDAHTDANHCGACDVVCPGACEDAQCQLVVSPAPAPADAGGGDPEPPPDGGGLACADGLTACQGGCYELYDDPMNCGSCAHVCPYGDVCSLGACVLFCPSGFSACPLATAGLPPKPTTTVHLVANLDAGTWPKGMPFDPNDGVVTSDFSTTLPLYDSLGQLHDISLYFVAQGFGDWEVHVLANGAEMAQPQQGIVEVTPAPIALDFDPSGALSSATDTTLIIDFANALQTHLELDLGTPTTLGGSGIDGVTQFGSPSSIFAQGQDGHAAVAPVNAGLVGEACFDAHTDANHCGACDVVCPGACWNAQCQ